MRKQCTFHLYFPKGQKSSRLLSENIDLTFDLNQNKLCVYGLSKKRHSGITECINLELSEMIREMNN